MLLAEKLAAVVKAEEELLAAAGWTLVAQDEGLYARKFSDGNVYHKGRHSALTISVMLAGQEKPEPPVVAPARPSSLLLEDKTATLENFRWSQDDRGEFWLAELWINHRKKCDTGSYEDSRTRRPSREEQLAELHKDGLRPVDGGKRWIRQPLLDELVRTANEVHRRTMSEPAFVLIPASVLTEMPIDDLREAFVDLCKPDADPEYKRALIEGVRTKGSPQHDAYVRACWGAGGPAFAVSTTPLWLELPFESQGSFLADSTWSGLAKKAIDTAAPFAGSRTMREFFSPSEKVPEPLVLDRDADLTAFGPADPKTVRERFRANHEVYALATKEDDAYATAYARACEGAGGPDFAVETAVIWNSLPASYKTTLLDDPAWKFRANTLLRQGRSDVFRDRMIEEVGGG